MIAPQSRERDVDLMLADPLIGVAFRDSDPDKGLNRIIPNAF